MWKGSWALTLDTTGSWWLLGEESVFLLDVTPGELTMLLWIVVHPRVYGQHKLELKGNKKKRHVHEVKGYGSGGNLWNIKERNGGDYDQKCCHCISMINKIFEKYKIIWRTIEEGTEPWSVFAHICMQSCECISTCITCALTHKNTYTC